MRKLLLVLGASAVLAGATGAYASENEGSCGNAPRDQWMSTDAAKAKAVSMGYEVRRVKIEGGCYEIYAIGKDGKRTELNMNPVSGAIVASKDDD
ncbi:PepSY domain-containing protein [Breoghania sp. L-A4]|uniref:PepSY domain-containing protein n=1 Tax=Breoghania sp. L-A4 TaxID=2304600 RepID=UPI000E35EB14|nr:PepSY domain-containing protein [Breoghania sp. L-A4]AXS41776.1 PepSY domain-containing protein [Breoghania sp. L-A4]